MNDEQRGLYTKYTVTRRDGSSAPGGKHDGCNYFVLDVTHDKYADPALLAYADSCAAEYPALAADLRDLASQKRASGAVPQDVVCVSCLQLRTIPTGTICAQCLTNFRAAGAVLQQEPQAWPSEAQLEGLKDYVIWHGGAHTEDCPGDDTCECACKPLNDAVNSILREWFDRAVANRSQIAAAPVPCAASPADESLLAKVNQALTRAGSRWLVGTKDGAIAVCTVEDAMDAVGAPRATGEGARDEEADPASLEDQPR